MPLGKTAAVVIGGFALGESDRVVTFYTRDFGKVRGVAKSARRARSRFGGALELFTLGTLVFFDSGRSDLVSVDHFDVARPFRAVREDLTRLGHAAWMVECVSRLTPDRDPHAAVYGILVRALRSLDGGVPPGRALAAFGVRCLHALGHGLRTDACVACWAPRRGREWGAIDLDAGGVVCPSCAARAPGLTVVRPRAVEALGRLATMAWDEAMTAQLGRVDLDLRDVLDGHVARLAGTPARVPRFLREVATAFRVTGENA